MPTHVLYTAFLYYVVFEGALRKWIFPSLTNELFVFKDLLLFAAFFSLWISERRGIMRNYHFHGVESGIWQTWIVISIAGLVLSGMTLSGFAGLRYYIAALPILLLQPFHTPSPEKLSEFFSQYVVVAIGVCLLGFVQFMSPPDAAINAYSWSPGTDMDVATFGEVSDRGAFSGMALVRITGTFSYIAPYAAYLQFMVFVCLALLLLAKTDRARVFYSCGLLLLLANVLMTGSRAPVLLTLVLALFYLPEIGRMVAKQSVILNIAIGLFIVSAAGWVLVDLIGALAERHQVAQDTTERTSGALFMPIWTVLYSPWIGDGIGATFTGMTQLTGTGLKEFKHDEVFQDRLGVDLGVFGYLFFFAVKVYFLGAAYVLVKRARTEEIRIWALVSFTYQASLVWTIPIYNAVACVFYFISIAMFALLRSANNAAGRVPSRAARYPLHARFR